MEAFVSLYEGEWVVYGFKEKIRKKSLYFIPIFFFFIIVGRCVFWRWLYILESGCTLYDFGVMKIYGFGIGNFQRKNGGLQMCYLQ